jgi:putative pyruvate formate lyase activating enzyme
VTRPPIEEIRERAARATRRLDDCRSCPRDCGVDRTRGETGHCGTGRYGRVCSAFPHHGEEACLSGTRGSGTIFFSLCNLSCVFCQNWDTSQRVSGEEVRPEELAGVMLDLQRMGCHNVNLVSPSHVVPQVVEALALAIDHGLSLPVVYNTGGYDSIESLELVEGLVDIYMPDFKFWDTESGHRLSDVPDYPERAREAIREMHRQVGPLAFGRNGLAERGVLVRHLVMPGQAEQTAAILQWLAEEVSPDTFVNLMGQYRPAHKVGNCACGESYPEIDRRPTPDELRAALAAARNAGLTRLDD